MTKSKFRISPFTFLFALIWWIMGNGLVFVYYLIALFLHEKAHQYVAGRLGYVAEKIVISPFGATLYADTDEFTSKDEIKIALAGPMCSALLALICVCAWWVYPECYNYTMDFCMANFSIMLLNILPIFPLDGGRILCSKLSQSMSRRMAAKIVGIIALCFGMALIFLSIISIFTSFNYTFGVVGSFVIISAISGNKENSYKRALDFSYKTKKLMRGLSVKKIMVERTMPLSKVYSIIDLSGYFEIVVVDENFNCLFEVSESEFMQLLKTFPSTTQIGDTHIDKSGFDW